MSEDKEKVGSTSFERRIVKIREVLNDSGIQGRESRISGLGLLKDLNTSLDFLTPPLSTEASVLVASYADLRMSDDGESLLEDMLDKFGARVQEGDNPRSVRVRDIREIVARRSLQAVNETEIYEGKGSAIGVDDDNVPTVLVMNTDINGVQMALNGPGLLSATGGIQITFFN